VASCWPQCELWEQILKLKELLDVGAITQAQFEEKRGQLLAAV